MKYTNKFIFSLTAMFFLSGCKTIPISGTLPPVVESVKTEKNHTQAVNEMVTSFITGTTSKLPFGPLNTQTQITPSKDSHRSLVINFCNEVNKSHMSYFVKKNDPQYTLHSFLNQTDQNFQWQLIFENNKTKKKIWSHKLFFKN